MSALWTRENFEGASNGTTISSSNTIFSFINGSPTISTDQAVIGTRCMKVSTTASTYVATANYTATSKVCISFYIFIATWGGNAVVVSQNRSSSTSRAEVQLIDSSGNPRLRLRNASTQVYTPTVNMPTGQWIRVDWTCDGANSQQRALWYTGANLHSTNTSDASEDTGNVTFNTGTINNTTFGQVNSVASSNTIYFDVVAGDNSVLPGPAISTGGAALTASSTLTVAATTASGTSTSALTATSTLSASASSNASVAIGAPTSTTTSAPVVAVGVPYSSTAPDPIADTGSMVYTGYALYATQEWVVSPW